MTTPTPWLESGQNQISNTRNRNVCFRLDRLRAIEECRSLLKPLDHQGLLTGAEIAPAAPEEPIDEDELLAELGDAAGTSDMTSPSFDREYVLLTICLR